MKLGIIGPFEGVGRRLGYAILPAVKAELAAANRRHPGSSLRVALVALNDDLDPGEAAAQADALVQDPDIIAVVGPWSDSTAAAATPILARAHIPTLIGVPVPGSGPDLISICPGLDQLALELLRRAKVQAGEDIVLAGPDNALRQALLTQDPQLSLVSETSARPCADANAPSCSVIYSGDAEGAAALLRRWRAAGWQGVFLGGPEVARPWFTEWAGASADGSQAVVCGNLSTVSADQDVSLAIEADSAGMAAQTILSALDQVTAGGKSPTREALAGWLASHGQTAGLGTLVVRDGRWVALRE